MGKFVVGIILGCIYGAMIFFIFFAIIKDAVVKLGIRGRDKWKSIFGK